MKALVKNNGVVGINVLDSLNIQDNQDVIIRVALTGLCRTDIRVASDEIKTSKNALILGHEFSGIVSKTGDGVSHVKVGSRVCVMPFLNTQNEFKMDMLGMHADGSMAEYIRVPSYCVYSLPDNITLKSGAYMEPICASMAVLKAPIKPSDKGVIIGDNRIAGLTLKILNAKGFSDVLIFDPNNKDGKPLLENTYDFVIETILTDDLVDLVTKTLKPQGVLILKSRQYNPVSINIAQLVAKEINIHAVNYGDFQDAIDLVAEGNIHFGDLLGDVYPLDDYQHVFELAQNTKSKKLFLTAASSDVWSS